MLISKAFLIVFNYPFNHLTGQRVHTIVVKNCSKSANAHKKREKSHYVPTGSRK